MEGLVKPQKCGAGIRGKVATSARFACGSLRCCEG